MTSIVHQARTGGLFQGYSYGYPHKMAYRALTPQVPLADVWQAEEKHSLFLYVHVPFCRVRCGFCNLFTTTEVKSGSDEAGHYLDALERQSEALAGALGTQARAARMAVGGGTPTFLTIAEFDRLFRLSRAFAPSAQDMPLAVEMSPDTVDAEKLAFLRETGTTRASLGVQSFVETETRALGRPQRPQRVDEALTLIRAAGFPVRNIDLIYGITGQDWNSWRSSLERALQHEPEELFLYPLYVRPLTGLGRKDKTPSDDREDLYRRGRDWLLERGYQQVSMRLFRSPSHPGISDVHYCCQEDGMIGLGAGARSYTRALHYSTEWAVGRHSVRDILQHFTGLTSFDHAHATHGAFLDEAEQRRRYVIKSLLRAEGLDLDAYHARFGTEAMTDLPELAELLEAGAAVREGPRLRPTQLGLEWSDVIGPWLYSERVKADIAAFEIR